MIPFTQYLRPDGHKITVGICRPDHIERKARLITNLGYEFEVELLTTGHVSLTIRDAIDPDTPDVAIELVPNGPLVPDAVDRLITNFRPIPQGDRHDNT